MVLLLFQFKLKIAVHPAHMKKKIYEVKNLLILFQKELMSLLCFYKKSQLHFKMRKVIFQRPRRLKSQNFHLGVNHGHRTDFSKLVNLCRVEKCSLISTPTSRVTTSYDCLVHFSWPCVQIHTLKMTVPTKMPTSQYIFYATQSQSTSQFI